MKKLSILLIMVFVLNLFVVGNVFAANLCIVKAYYNPSNPYQGTELTIKMSVSDITKGIKAVNFTLDYDANNFEFSKIEKADGWTAELSQNQITIHTDDNNATTKAGDLGTIVLKVKDNATVGNTPVKISNIQVAKEDNSKLNFGELEQNITIQKNNIEKEDNNSSDSNKNDDKTDTNKDNTQENSKVDNNANTDNANKNNTQDVNKIDNNVNNNNDISTNQKEDNNTDNKDTNNIDTINKEETAKTNQEENKSNNQKSSTDNTNTNTEKTNSKAKTSNKKSNKKDLPYTGYSNIYIAIAVIGVTIYAIIAYKKYKNV